MDGLFNSPVLIKLQEFGQKLGTNKYMSALQSGMMGSIAIIMTGSVFQILCAVLNMFGVASDSMLYIVLYQPYNYTMGLVGIWIAAMIAYNYAKNLGVKSPIISMIETLFVYVLISCFDVTQGSSISTLNVTYLGSTGMFVGFLCAFLCVRVDWFCEVKHIQIKMPDVCPPSLVNSMAAIIPAAFNAAWALALSYIIYATTGGAYTFASGFMAVLSAPLAGLTSAPGMFILVLIATLMWCFGIHGTMLIMPIIMAPGIQATANNAAAWEAVIAAGGTWKEAEAAMTFYPIALFGGCAICGGTGNTLPLCLMGLRSKSQQIQAVAKVGVVPGWFGINEPVTFGMPIMYNPILCIPYILNCQLVMLCTLLAYKVGFLVPGHVYVGALMPMGFAAFLSSFRWQNALWDYICMIPAGLVWYPFFKAYEKQLVAREAEAAAAEA